MPERKKMKAYYLTKKEYDKVHDLLIKSESNVIRYHGLIVEYLENENEIICTYEKDVLSGKYEWYFIPNPADYE